MSDFEFLLFKSIVLNAVTIGFFIWALFGLERGQVKQSFLFMLGVIFFFINAINLFQIPGLSADQAALSSKCIFAAAISMNGAFGHFLLTFCAPGERRHIRYWLFQANMVVLVLLSFSDLLSAGVRQGPSGFVPVYGPLHKYAAVSIAICDIYIFWAILRQYRRITDELLRYQIQGLSWASLITFLAIISTNGLIPAFLGDSELSRASAFWPLFYFTGLLHIIINGKTMFLSKSFRRLVKDATKVSEDNIWSLRQLLHTVDQVVHEKPPAFRHLIAFTGEAGERVELNISRGTEETDADKIDLRQGLPQKWFRGFLENLYRLESDNKRLAFALVGAEQAHRQLRAGQAGRQERGLLLQDETEITDYRASIAENMAENRDSFGVELLCFSDALFQILTSLRKFRHARLAVVFEGETGTGKSLLARALHGSREGGPLLEASGLQATPEELRAKIAEFLALDESERPGLLIRHLDALADGDFRLLAPVLEEHTNRFVYFTALPDFLLHPPEMPARMLYRLRQLSVQVPPLRDRPEDLFHQVLHFADECNRTGRLGFEEISRTALDEALRHTWPGNSRELKHCVERIMLGSPPPLLESLQLQEPLALPGVPEGLSPLEESEREVIIKYLKKNNFNKTRTRRDLGITINTLNSKMQRYGIQGRKK